MNKESNETSSNRPLDTNVKASKGESTYQSSKSKRRRIAPVLVTSIDPVYWACSECSNRSQDQKAKHCVICGAPRSNPNPPPTAPPSSSVRQPPAFIPAAFRQEPDEDLDEISDEEDGKFKLGSYLMSMKWIGRTTARKRSRMGKDELLQRNMEIQQEINDMDDDYEEALKLADEGGEDWEERITELDRLADRLASEQDHVEELLERKFRVKGGGRFLVSDVVLAARKQGTSHGQSAGRYYKSKFEENARSGLGLGGEKVGEEDIASESDWVEEEDNEDLEEEQSEEGGQEGVEEADEDTVDLEGEDAVE
eukprot:1389904-Amorphochlora_amoeboformis.AAC.1